jgi:hypothetical protein
MMNVADFVFHTPANRQESQNPEHLIEGNTRHYLKHLLKTCHENRLRIYSIAFNAIILFFLVILGCSVLYYRRKQKLTPFEEYEKQMRDQEMILSKIKQFQIEKMRHQESLANLPDTYTPVIFQ